MCLDFSNLIKKKPKRIPVKIQWNDKEQRLVLIDSKGEKIKTLYCDSSLSLYLDEQIYDGRVEMSRHEYPDSHGYYFLYDSEEKLYRPITNNYHYFVWVDECNEPILCPETVSKIVEVYG